MKWRAREYGFRGAILFCFLGIDDLVLRLNGLIGSISFGAARWSSG